MHCIDAGVIDKIGVGIQQKNKPPPRKPYPLIVRFCKAVVHAGRDELHVVLAAFEGFQRINGPIGRIIVDDDDFERGFIVKIGKKAFKTFECQVFCVVADEYD